MIFQRYALYFTPEADLAERGAAWLGWDMAAGAVVPHPQIDGIDVAALTKTPRKYGLHATIKPPMVLAKGTTRDALEAATSALAKSTAAVTLDGLHLSRIGRFLALTPLGDTNELNALAAHVVKTLDPFRAPASDQELARRRARPLSASQEQNLIQWGYPHVMQDFHFHITLTGSLNNAEAIAPVVAAHFNPVLPTPFTLNSLTLAGEDSEGMFHAITRFPLEG